MKSHALCHTLPLPGVPNFFHEPRNSEIEHMPSKLWVAGSNPAGVAKPMNSNNFFSFEQCCAESGESCCSTVRVVSFAAKGAINQTL